MHKQLYNSAQWLGVSCVLCSVVIGGGQLFLKAQIAHQATIQQSISDRDATIQESKADQQKREAKAFQDADRPQIKTLGISNLTAAQITPYIAIWATLPSDETLIYDKFWNCAGLWKDRKFTPDPTVCKPYQTQ